MMNWLFFFFGGFIFPPLKIYHGTPFGCLTINELKGNPLKTDSNLRRYKTNIIKMNGIVDNFISLEEILQDINKHKNNTKNDGYDHRFQSNQDEDYEKLYLIRVNIQRKILLHMLENNKISEKEKELAAINYLDENKLSKYAPNIFSGGLLDDWTY